MNRQRHLRLVGLALVAGIGNEVTAKVTGAWVYDPAWLALVNIAVMFCGVMAWIAARWYESPRAVLFAVGAAVGTAYEFFNGFGVRMWSFPDDRFLVFRGYVAISIVVGLMWGMVPLLTAEVLRVLERRAAPVAG